MSATVYGKWYWSDWMSDPGVRASSYAARGLWIDLLCLAAMADPTGYVVLNGRPLTAAEIARVTGGDSSEVEILLDELARNGVFTRDRLGRIYSRRMVREVRNSKTNRENGKKGGNPNLRKQSDNPDPDNPQDKREVKTQKPESKSQKPEASKLAELRVNICRTFEEKNRMAPDTSRAGVWLSQDYDPVLIVAVVREVLARNPDIRSLSYFDKRLAEAHAGKAAPKALGMATAGLAATPPPRYERRHLLRFAMDHFRGELAQGVRPEVNPADLRCEIPVDVLDEARAVVDREKAALVAFTEGRAAA